MLRGINRYIIEINDPNSDYFDKVLLFVNPNYNESDDEKLKKEGKRIINISASEKNVINGKKSRKKGVVGRILPYIVGAIIGAALKFITDII